MLLPEVKAFVSTLEAGVPSDADLLYSVTGTPQNRDRNKQHRKLQGSRTYNSRVGY
jgi:hypothetical protein